MTNLEVIQELYRAFKEKDYGATHFVRVQNSFMSLYRASTLSILALASGAVCCMINFRTSKRGWQHSF